MLDYAGKVHDEPRGWEAKGTGPSQRFYQARDGWFFLAACPSERGRVVEAVGLRPSDVADDAAFERALEARFAEDTVGAWVDRLRETGVSAQIVVALPDLMVDPWVVSHGLSVTQCSEEAGDVTYPGPSPCLSDTPVRLGAPVRQPGADAGSVLAEVGQAETIETLDRQWVLQASNLPRGW